MQNKASKIEIDMQFLPDFPQIHVMSLTTQPPKVSNLGTTRGTSRTGGRCLLALLLSAAGTICCSVGLPNH